MAAKVGRQLVGRGAVCHLCGGTRQKPGRETGPDPGTLGLSAGLQVQRGLTYSAENLRQKLICVD